jgi:EmrB/QacA subfamily drug resistance transporter
MLCGFSWNNTSMISFRILQAIGGGMIMPVGMSMIYQVFPKERIGLALGIWGIASMAAPAIGPTLGGYIIEKLDWRLIFNLNVPIGIIGVILAAVILKDTSSKKSKPFDIIGFASSTVGLVSILYVLGEWPSIDWSNALYPILLTLGCLCMLLFVVNELTHPDPLLDLGIFKLFNFTVSQVIVCILTLSLMGGMYVMPLFLQNIRGYTAIHTGLIMLPPAIVMGLLMPISGMLFDKLGSKPIVIPGLVILAISSYLLSSSINMNSSSEFIMLILCIRSIGIGIAMMPINTEGMNCVPQALISKASAISSTIRQVCSSLSITITTVIIQNKTNYNYSKLSEQITIYNKASNNTISSLTNAYVQSGLPASSAKASALGKLTQLLQGQSTIDAMAYAICVTAAVVIAAIFLSFLIRGKKRISKTIKVGD